jgi:hypothetical protein
MLRIEYVRCLCRKFRSRRSLDFHFSPTPGQTADREVKQQQPSDIRSAVEIDHTAPWSTRDAASWRSDVRRKFCTCSRQWLTLSHLRRTKCNYPRATRWPGRKNADHFDISVRIAQRPRIGRRPFYFVYFRLARSNFRKQAGRIRNLVDTRYHEP